MNNELTMKVETKPYENLIPNFMTYNGNMLFHFTKFESALKIIATNCLLLGRFENMNDISESRREIFDDELEEEISLYKSLSFTMDRQEKRAFEIDSLWGYYAEKGNGVCLVFDKSKLLEYFKKMDGFRKDGAISYIQDFSNAIFPESTLGLPAREEIEEICEKIFFTKSRDWEVESEYRFLIRPAKDSSIFLDIADSLIAVILCSPLLQDIKNSAEYKIISRQTSLPLLRYTTGQWH